MNRGRRVLLGVLFWTGVITALHFALNFNWSVLRNEQLPENRRKLNVAYIPVT